MSKIIFVAPLVKEGFNKEFIFIMDELNITKDLKDTIQYFYLLIFFIIIIIIFVLSYLYSKMISKPLIEAVENNAEHMCIEEMQRIWDRFYRLDKSRSKESGGTGLGLAIVNNILKLHDSEFGVKNTDIGVEFHFTLQIASIETCQKKGSSK